MRAPVPQVAAGLCYAWKVSIYTARISLKNLTEKCGAHPSAHRSPRSMRLSRASRVQVDSTAARKRTARAIFDLVAKLLSQAAKTLLCGVEPAAPQVSSI